MCLHTNYPGYEGPCVRVKFKQDAVSTCYSYVFAGCLGHMLSKALSRSRVSSILIALAGACMRCGCLSCLSPVSLFRQTGPKCCRFFATRPAASFSALAASKARVVAARRGPSGDQLSPLLLPLYCPDYLTRGRLRPLLSLNVAAGNSRYVALSTWATPVVLVGTCACELAPSLFRRLATRLFVLEYLPASLARVRSVC